MVDFHSESIDRLFKVILNLKTVNDCYDFFEDVCTIKEIQNMAQRLDAAVLLDSGENYQEISRKLDTSTATISRVSRCLNYGSGGYRKALDYIKNEKD
ncbi:MAG: hypothetical protein II749_02345 [Clostridia bacterium]|nr:hypothetical protein [Clostridia bacterium]